MDEDNYLTSEGSVEVDDEVSLEEDYSREEEEEIEYLSKRKAPGRRQRRLVEEDDEMGWEEEYGYIENHQQDESLMTERQRAKQERQRQTAINREIDYDGVSEKTATKKVKTIYNTEQLARKQELEESRKLKQKEANYRMMEETVQKILNEFSNKKTKLSVTEKREKKRAEMFQQKVGSFVQSFIARELNWDPTC